MGKQSQLRLPNLFIVGAQKAGTTSLYDWLAQHPDIYGLKFTKDLPFFADEKLFSEGIESYRKLFTGVADQQYLMAGSVHNMFFPRAIERLYKYCPDARILVLVRNPLNRAISAYRFAVQRGLEDRSFDESVFDELAAAQEPDELYSSTLDQFQKFYVARGLYSAQLKKLYSLFPPEQVFVGVFEDMIKAPDDFLVRLFEFLKLESVPIETKQKNRTAGLPRSQLVSKLYYNQEIRDSWMISQLKRFIPQRVRFRMRRSVLALNTDYSAQPIYTMSAQVKQQLRRVFHDDLESLGTVESRSWLSKWGLLSDNDNVDKGE